MGIFFFLGYNFNTGSPLYTIQNITWQALNVKKKIKEQILSRIFQEINQINYKSFAWSKLQLK